MKRLLSAMLVSRACTLLLSLFFICPGIEADELKPFATDGCSLFPEGTQEQQTLWQNCCIAHDKAYWLGGTAEQRQQADLALEQCVANLGEPYIAKLMLAGVLIGGSPLWDTPFRWGYGWAYRKEGKLRGYHVLTEEEQKRAAEALIQIETGK